MMINWPNTPDKILIYPEIPKTNGTAIKNTLYNIMKDLSLSADYLTMNDYLFSSMGDPRVIHTTLREYYDKWFFHIPEKWSNNTFKFTFVRNPWDRILSWYFWCVFQTQEGNWITVNRMYPQKKLEPNKENFGEWLCWLNSFPSNNIWQKGWMTNLHWIKNSDDEIDMDFIGKLENFEQDWELLCQMLKIDEPMPSGNINPIKKIKPYHEFYSQKSVDIVASVCKEEIEFFGYEF
tara:strand:+ start:993 stop:1697 length:705 start_codon:yes stop_codon:yes gene_type:complete